MGFKVKTGAILLGVIVAGVSLTACSSVAEKAVEQAVEQGTGVDVNTENGGVSVTNSEGTTEFNASGVTVPDTWPTSVPLYTSGTMTTAGVSAEGEASGMWTVEGTTAQEVFDQYSKQLTDAGYASTSNTVVSGTVGADFDGAEYTVNVGAFEADGNVTLIVGATLKS